MPYGGLLSDIGFYNFPTSKPVKMVDRMVKLFEGLGF
jgi:hypothetical protein